MGRGEPRPDYEETTPRMRRGTNGTNPTAGGEEVSERGRLRTLPLHFAHSFALVTEVCDVVL